MNLTLGLYLHKTSADSVSFPEGNRQQMLLSNYKYSATRMGNAPSISGTVKYPVLLDGEWSSEVYVIHNGERYYLKNTPSSSYDDKSFLYSYNLEFVAERAMLNNIYFFDVIHNQESEYNIEESEFSFSGDIYMFKDKLNLSLESSGLYGSDKDKYEVIVDEGIVSESKLYESSNQYITDALNTAYEIYGVPYYFVGKKIHFGNYQDYIDETFECESGEYLMSATRDNSNVQIINKITGYGSERNIPYYYPNPTPEGYIGLGGASKNKYYIIDDKKFSSRVRVDRTFSVVMPSFTDVTNSGKSSLIEVLYPVDDYPIVEENWFFYVAFEPGVYTFKFTMDKARGDRYWPDYIPVLITEPGSNYQVDMSDIFWKGDVSSPDNSKKYGIYWNPDRGTFYIDGSSPSYTLGWDYVCTMHLHFNKRRVLYFRTLSNSVDVYEYTSKIVKKGGSATFLSEIEVPKGSEGIMYATPNFHKVGYPDASVVFGDFTGGYIIDANGFRSPIYTKNGYIFLGNRKAGRYTVEASYNITTGINPPNDLYVKYYNESTLTWLYNDDLSEVNLGDIGIGILQAYSVTVGDSLCKEIVKRINTKKRLMPSIYRDSDGQHKWYMAANDTYKDDNGEFFEFSNEYSESNQKEFIHTIESIYPTISEATNLMDQRIDMFAEITVDRYDNNEIYPEDYEDQNLAGKYKHPYFFAKLRKTNGNKSRSFNLFDCAIEGEPMKISFTSGHVASCEFEIGVDEKTQKNPVQVDENGDLVRDDDGNVVFDGTPQDVQQDTLNNEVWIALKKEDTTMGVMMPDTASNIIPTINDTFVILGINLPNSYYIRAEERLETELIKYMSENNSDRYSFSLKFSSIYLAENIDRIYNILNENSFVRVSYMGKTYEMFVNNYSVSVKEDTLLPEVNITLTDEIKLVETKKQKIEKLAELANKGLNMSISTTKKSAAISARTDSIEAKIQSIQNNQGDTSIPELVELVSQNTVNIQDHSERIAVLEGQTPGDVGPGADFDEVKEWVEETLESYAKMPTEPPTQDSILIYDSNNSTFKGSDVSISTTVQDIENGEDSKIPTCAQVLGYVDDAVLNEQDILYIVDVTINDILEHYSTEEPYTISDAIINAIRAKRRILIPLDDSNSYVEVTSSRLYSDVDYFELSLSINSGSQVIEIESYVHDIDAHTIECYTVYSEMLATDSRIVNYVADHAQEKLISGENIKTMFGQSVLGDGDVLGEFKLEIQNTGTYYVGSIANARIVRNGVTTPIDINVETYIGNGPSVYVTLSQSGELQVRGTIGGVYLSYLANGTIQDDFIPSTIARTADIKQPDWNESDSSSNAYINNRTHYFQTYGVYEDLSTYNTSVGENFGPVGEYFSLGGYVYKSSDIVGQEFNCAPYGPSVIVSVVIETTNGYDEFFLKFVSGTLSSGISIPFCWYGSVKTIDDVYIPDTIARKGDIVTTLVYKATSKVNNVLYPWDDKNPFDAPIINHDYDVETGVGVICFSGIITTIGDRAFHSCHSITSITIPNSVTLIGYQAFYRCTKLTSITIPDSVTSIGNMAFYNCSSLTSATIGNSVTEIGYQSFHNCTNLTTVTIPDSVASIGHHAFCDCRNLTSVCCEAVAPPTTIVDSTGWWVAFDFNSSDRKIYVPMESVETYKSAYRWGEYADDIVGYYTGENIANELTHRNVGAVDPSGEVDDTISLATTEYVDTAIAIAITTTLNTPV